MKNPPTMSTARPLPAQRRSANRLPAPPDEAQVAAVAGGLEAFISGTPAAANPEMAFALLQHLVPHYKNILTELIRRYTRMQVFEVTLSRAKVAW